MQRRQGFTEVMAAVLPVAFLLFVAPGFVWLWVLWKWWSSISEYPTSEEIRESVAALSSAALSSTPA